MTAGKLFLQREAADIRKTAKMIDEVRPRRRRLVRENGGLRGWVAHLRPEQKKDTEKLVPPRARITPQ